MSMLEVEELSLHMKDAREAERDLRELNLLLQTIEASASISCPREVQSMLPTLVQTRESFGRLQASLVTQLVSAHVDKLKRDLAGRAQCAIDILVRNLYERTADVGFLATDGTVRAFAREGADPAWAELHRPAMVERLAAYRDKYSVYDDVLLLAPDGEVRVRLDAGAALARSADPIVAAALAADGHVERFGPSDLGTDPSQPALLYAHRILAATGGAPVGVLVLRFRFVDEMTAIFHGLIGPGERGAVALVDPAGRVVASSHAAALPVGARLDTGIAGELVHVELGGRDVLAVTCPTRGYQGYQGPGWCGFAMVPLGSAFREARSADEAAPQQGRFVSDNPALNAIEDEAGTINRNLRRVVWNGRVMAGNGGRSAEAAARLKAVLTQVSAAGDRTRERVSRSVGDLFRTSQAAAIRQAGALARLAADIMDRNLYERANDCRWWALSPDLLRLMAAPHEAAGTRAINALLDHVNGLYTVYTRLLVFDRDGVIRGASREDAAGGGWVGRRMDPALVAAVGALDGPQCYTVSAFAPTPLYDDRPTYVYAAALRDRAALGGIAVVFDGATEFRAMLDATVVGQSGALAAFVDADGRVVSCNDPRFAPGTAFPLADAGGLVAHDGRQYACGTMLAGGYREFKLADGYRNDVRAVVALPLGRSNDRRGRGGAGAPPPAASFGSRAAAAEFAVFRIAATALALPVETVAEAVAPRDAQFDDHGGDCALGVIEVADEEGARRVVGVVDGRTLIGQPRAAQPADGVVVLVRDPRAAPGGLIGLWVDELLWVGEYDAAGVHAAAPVVSMRAPLLQGFVRTGDASDALMPVLSAERLSAWVAEDGPAGGHRRAVARGGVAEPAAQARPVELGAD